MCGNYIGCGKVVESKPVRRLTKRQAEVLALHHRLKGLTDCQRRWMLSVPFRKQAKWDTMKHEIDGRLCTVVQSVGSYTVFRTFMAEKYLDDERQDIHEVYENWLHDDGKETVISVPYRRSLWSMTWIYDGEWTVKHHNGHCGGYYVWEDVFSVEHNFMYPVWRVSKMLERNGWRKKLVDKDVDPIVQMQRLLTDNDSEMLVKTGQIKLFNYLIKMGGAACTKWLPSVRICNRNGYVIDDASLWLDYIDLLTYFHLDVHSPHYVCPDDLKTEHDRLLGRKMRIIEREQRQRMIREAARYEKEYRERIARYLDLRIEDVGIMVFVIPSVAEMAEEGEAMHHCVYTNEYFRKENCLILSARDGDGNRLETVEVNTKTWKIIQSRGLLNNPSPRHADIVRIVNENMNLLKAI